MRRFIQALLLVAVVVDGLAPKVGCKKCSSCLGCASKNEESRRNECVVVVTHAAGRMGLSLVGQLREMWARAPPAWASPDAALRVRCVVRSDAEAAAMRTTLGGVVMRGGVAEPASALPDLDVVVAPDAPGDAEDAALDGALAGASAVVLCSAAHAALEANDRGAYNVRVPRAEAAVAARRLGAEIAAAARAPLAGPRRVVLRSSAGVGVLDASIRGATAVPDDAVLAVARMGGEEAVRAHAAAEAAFSKLSEAAATTTVLRLGALTDDAGGVPLRFAVDDDDLLEAAVRRGAPPLISRNDAARVVAEIAYAGASDLRGATIGVAWNPKYTPTCAGTDEVMRAAARQDVVADAAAVLAAAARRAPDRALASSR